MFGLPGYVELIIVALVILLLFGNRLPSVMKSLGQGIVEFKKGINEVTEESPSESKAESNSSSNDS
ncbi:Sec-independent protein translocase subunit TatA/TatB [Calycomorphotria hydatis]|uniref:Sec-independent protein translocase protein TatA n=1 Tax=Calycomorphotria hydatis TaxID=2528027 RepID=A0A517TA88_9PLAN|nr:twin-arginine translocase TatA/TatE family subunit [Calycomorphotria hydatis]QDT65286.1 twin arginine translocase protein A [Calycomorphotria hydatis]